MTELKERFINTGIQQSLIVRLTGIKQSTLSQYFSLDRNIKKEHKEQIEAVISHYEQALIQIKTQL